MRNNLQGEDEIIPVEIKDRKGNVTIVDTDKFRVHARAANWTNERAGKEVRKVTSTFPKPERFKRKSSGINDVCICSSSNEWKKS